MPDDLRSSLLPFGQPGRWLRGNLHVHSTASDGDRSPEQVIEWYRSRGYHFLALTDHRTLSTTRVVGDDFLVLAGIEADGTDPQSGLYHLVGLGLERPPEIAWDAGLPMQEAVNRLRQAGGLVMLAHPYWSGQRSTDLLDLKGCFGLEVYNGGCEVDDARGFSTVHWDDLLAAGRCLWGTAVDDAHWRRQDHDAGLGWVWLKAAELNRDAILLALERGCFYSSSGPIIHDMAVDTSRGQVHVRCSPVTAIDFVGRGWRSRRVSAPHGGTITEAEHWLLPGQGYVRVSCLDGYGRWAWTNPVHVDSCG